MDQNIHIVKKVLACLTAAGLLLSFAGCGGSPDATPAAAASEEESVILVKTQKGRMGDLTQSTEYIGTVEPDDLVQVLPKMGGTVSRVLVSVGDTVKKGDLLMTMDTTDLQVSLAAQQAAVEVARAAVMTAQAQVDQSLGSTFDVNLAQLETSVQQAKNAYASARQGLRDYNDNNSSPADQVAIQRDKARENVQLLSVQEQTLKTKLETLKNQSESDPQNANLAAEYLSLKNQYSDISSALASAESQLSMLNSNYNDDDMDATLRNLRTSSRNAQLAYDSANTIYELTKGEVRNDALKVANASLGQAAASYDAQVKSYEAAAHQLSFAQVTSPIDGIVEACSATENATIGTGSPVFTITNKSKLVVTFYVSEDAAKQLSLGDKVSIESGRSVYTGSVSEIGTMVDSTGLFKVKASLDEGELLSGVSVKVTASTGKAQGLLIPQSAIYYDAGQGYIYAYEDGKAVRRDILVGVSNNDLAEVIDGIDANTQLITTWNPNLRDGAPVTLASAEDAAFGETSSPAASSESESSGADSSQASESASAGSSPDGESAQEDAA